LAGGSLCFWLLLLLLLLLLLALLHPSSLNEAGTYNEAGTTTRPSGGR
jgi:hypothetical protein